jgi:hypothetical protein
MKINVFRDMTLYNSVEGNVLLLSAGSTLKIQAGSFSGISVFI